MSVKLMVVCSILLIPLAGVCDTLPNVTHEVTMSSSPDTSSSRLNQSVNVTDYHPSSEIQTLTTVALVLIPTVGVLGVCGNVVVLVVWSAETAAFNPTSFLIKCLAASDIVYLVDIVCTLYLTMAALMHWVVVMALFVVLLYSRIVSAHTTLGVVVTRCLAVHKPLRVHSLLTKRRVVTGYVLMLLWCLTAFLPVVFMFTGHTHHLDSIMPLFSVVESVYLALPILLLLVLNVSLVWRLCAHRRSFSTPQQHAAREARSSQLHSCVAAVLCVSITTVLAYPVGVAYRGVVQFEDVSTLKGCTHYCQEILYVITALLEVFNSSINVVYYLLFVSRFRQLCRRRCCCRR